MPEHILYVARSSAACRAVLLHCHLVREQFGPLEVVDVDLGKDEHKLPEFLRRNPLHTVPTLATPWGPLWESRAIMRYIESLLPEGQLYPTNVYGRAVVDRLLDWDLGTLYRATSSIVYPQIFAGLAPKTEDVDRLNTSTRFLDLKQLGDGRPFLCGRTPTIADISIAMTLSLLRLVGLEVDDVPRLTAWQQTMCGLDGHAEIDAPFAAWVAQLAGATPSQILQDEPAPLEQATEDQPAAP